MSIVVDIDVGKKDKKGGEKCKGNKKQGLKRVPAVTKNIVGCQHVNTDCQYVITDFKAKKGGNCTPPLDFAGVTQLAESLPSNHVN